MRPAWILMSFLLSGGRAFMIYSSEHSLCLEDSGTREVQLKRCSPDSESQQWLWVNQSMLMSAATSRCLYTRWSDDVVQMRPCRGPDPAGLEWDCHKGRLISRKTSLLLTASGQQVILSQQGKLSMWKSLDEEDFCKERLRLRRASNDPHQSDYEEDVEEVTDKRGGMTEEQRQFLRWFYRKEDSTMWKFVLLGLSFICLLFGFLLLGMGAMANKSRKKIAKYKAAAARRQKDEELQDSSGISDNGKPSHGGPPHSSTFNRETDELKAGSIVVTWKDGNTSCLYSDPIEEKQKEEEQTERLVLEQEGDDEKTE
ncbi:uncharacterized protein LOC101172640 [Oryzias latipes]|uniref:uncharacterized protein LOC101172640 n=1 Tax=Oryzias latipes TaxID=8090 RepID=UPI0000E9D527|nr:uncharacterized protein LOC101172640 [Oryzias latipes]